MAERIVRHGEGKLALGRRDRRGMDDDVAIIEPLDISAGEGRSRLMWLEFDYACDWYRLRTQ